MTFINEYIPKAHLINYTDNIIVDNWSIDRKRNIWLRRFSFSFNKDLRGKIRGASLWHYCWKGTLMLVTVQSVRTQIAGKKGEEDIYQKLKLIDINIPLNNQKKREEILADLEEAFRNYALVGVHARFRSSTLELEYEVNKEPQNHKH